jgi:hypothetical protein
MTPRPGRVYEESDRLRMATDEGPDVRTQSNQGQPSALQVLLVGDVLVGSNQDCEIRRFRSFEQLTVF